MMTRIFTAFVIGVLLSGCASMTSYERSEYSNLEYRLQKASLEPVKDKSPALAGVLNILPGVGNLYLEQYGIFVANLIFWPASVIWGVPQAAIDANTLNKQATLSYYNYGPGRTRLASAEASFQAETVSARDVAIEEAVEESSLPGTETETLAPQLSEPQPEEIQ